MSRRVGGLPITWRELAIVLTVIVFDLAASGLIAMEIYLHGQSFSVVLYGLIVTTMWLPLFLRHRFPITVWAWVVVAAIGIAMVFDYAHAFAAGWLALYSVAVRTGPRVSVPALALTCLSYLATIRSGWISDGDTNLPSYAFPIVVFSLVAATVWTLGRRDRNARGRVRALGAEIATTAQLAAEQERHRIARELHDILAHSVSAMMMQAAGAKAVTGTVLRQGSDGAPQPERLELVQQALESIETTGSQSMRELHRLLASVRGDDPGQNGADSEASIGESAPPGLGQIDDLAAVARDSGLIVEIRRSGTPVELDPSVGLAAYRVAQESLTNAIKHGGQGTVLDIFESWQEENLRLQIRSQSGLEGATPGTPNGGTGLYGLKERVELVGGAFQSGWAGDTFVTTAILPLSRRGDNVRSLS